MIEITQNVMEVTAEFTGGEFTVTVHFGTVTNLDDLTPPEADKTTAPDDATTIPAYFDGAWLKFSWAKLKEWLGTHFSPLKMTWGRTIEDATATLAVTDRYKNINGSRATAITVTIPEATFSQGDWGNIQQLGAGEVIMAVANGTNQFINDERQTAGQYKWIAWVCEDDTANNEVFKIIGGVEI